MSDKPPIDLTLLHQLDSHTIAAVHDRYYAEIYRYTRYRLDDGNAAEDLTSEVFIKLLEAIKKGYGPKESIKGWLMGTANHLINDYYRKKYQRPTTELENAGLRSKINPIEISENLEEMQQIRDAMINLTSEQQHVLALRFGGDYSLEETAAIMGKKVNAIKALQYRAIAALRRELEKLFT
jgi:RNA polymerase sigma-70 factor (ECF subfamily)